MGSYSSYEETRKTLNDLDREDIFEYLISNEIVNIGIDGLEKSDINDDMHIFVYSNYFCAYHIDSENKWYGKFIKLIRDIAEENEIRIKKQQHESDYETYLKLKDKFEGK